MAAKIDSVAQKTLKYIKTEESYLPEPEKPPYVITWPETVNEMAPDPDSPNLPLNLTRIIFDLKSIRKLTHDAGGVFVSSAFIWLAFDGMVLDTGKQLSDPLRDSMFGGVFGYLNQKNWPLLYRDIRRFVDFQNRVFRAFAERYDVPYIDVTKTFPQDPRLFYDAVHMTEEGIRLRSWLTFLRLTEIIEPLLKSKGTARGLLLAGHGVHKSRLAHRGGSARPRLQAHRCARGAWDKGVSRSFGIQPRVRQSAYHAR